MTVPAFDPVLARLRASPGSLTEAEVLAELWAHGEDGWLREDARFRSTPWGRWIPAERYLVNDLVVRTLRQGTSELSLREQLDELSRVTGRPTAFCRADPRLRVDDDRVRLAPAELTAEPLLEDIEPLLQYVTHLPVVSLAAAAASEPAGEWGPGAEAQGVEPLGWLRIEHLGRPLNRRMFVARVKGHSMDGGSHPIKDGAWVVFEFAFHEGVAYDPGTSRPTVLVRGEFADPETGTYAVKQWDRIAPEIRLCSLNPDRERFPDIVVPLDAASHLRVVATLARVLGAGDFARRPRPQRKPGRRLLEGSSGLTEQGARIGRRIDAFFAGRPPDADADDAPPGDGWQTRLVCLAADAGGLHLEIGPLAGLPPFVKKLRACGTEWDGLLLAANVRPRPDRLPVRPGSGPWRWLAVDFEDEDDLGLERLAADALPPASVTVFRVDAHGVGQRQDGTTLALGQAYRLLLAPGAGDDGSPGELLADGWRLWPIDLSSPPTAATRTALHRLGLEVGDAWPRLEWGFSPPSLWETTPRGERYPVFEAGTDLVVHAHGLPGLDDEAAVLFLRGPEATERLVLPHAEAALVSLGSLAPGRWACALLHPRASVRTTTLIFEVAANATRLVDATWSAAASDDLARLELTAPPGWPVALAWRVLGETPLATVHAESDGTVDLTRVRPRLIERARRDRVANLIVDLGELGHAVLQHDRRATVEQIREALTALWAQRQALVLARAGAWLTLVPSWFQPLTALLGYTMEELPGEPLPDGDHRLAAWRLVVDERSADRITRAASRALVLTSDLEAVVREALDWVDRACTAVGVREALITDGVRWTTHRRGNRLRRRTWDLGEALTHGDIETMLAELAEGL